MRIQADPIYSVARRAMNFQDQDALLIQLNSRKVTQANSIFRKINQFSIYSVQSIASRNIKSQKYRLTLRRINQFSTYLDP